MPSEVNRILTEARNLIADPARWTQEAYARNDRGYHVDSTHPTACCWCASGAMCRVNGPEPDSDIWTACIKNMREACAELFPHMSGFVAVNDHGTHADILKVFDRAIEMEAANA